ncbi:MAG: hypothetical protein EUB_01571 [Eubacterium sp.]|uniref:hypothetical protein n=1 Tax=Eubacterium sp. TaxID=142586 RepID=UPI00303736CD
MTNSTCNTIQKVHYERYSSSVTASAIYTGTLYSPKIRKVIFNNPATIVFWEDGTKTVVKANNEIFDPEKGLAMAISKKAFGNKGKYFDHIKKWTREYEVL